VPETDATNSSDGLQELLATQTTLLLQHRDVNPFAYTDGLQTVAPPPGIEH
jgi:hypothetical protein